MQREIKFRAFDKEAKTMHQVSVIDFEDKYVLYARNDFYKDKPFYMEKSFDEIELMQFTGLHDKNGKEIYEGDIVERRIKIREEENLYIEKVVFVSGAFQTECKEKELGDFYEAPFQTFEIIGNIHENPELLK